MDDRDNDNDNEIDYPVGFRRPPKHTQFKKGQSGNPRGRPKGSKNLKTLMYGMMMEPTVVRKGQRKRTLPALIALCHLQMAKAAAGDTKAFQVVTNLASREGMFHDMPAIKKSAKNEEPVQERVRRMLDQIAARLRGDAENGRPGPGETPIKP